MRREEHQYLRALSPSVSGAAARTRLASHVGGILARWHAWRATYSPERGYARNTGPQAPEDELEQLLMRSVETEVGCLPQAMQRAIAEAAHAECWGTDAAAPTTSAAEREAAVHRLAARLLNAGVLV